ncbi:MAG TPA: SDR family NAD(P)-dependent oxidoreductase [Candidatus Acidoferrales bacterium]|nr:SDR family NAD(P)-dependent oxidoreductase [Candidatus Acidoferrales bacterium]
MQIRFDGRTAIVTGAAHGLGRAIALNFAKLGARVVACDVLKNGLDETANLGEKQQAPLETRVLDVSDRSAVQAAISQVLKDRGCVDILVNDAGGVMGQVGRPLEDVSEADWRAIFRVNLDGAFYCCQAVAPSMKAARYGRIVNISSGAGLGISLTGIQAYASAKAGQIGLTRQLAHELGPWGITVNSVAPGFIRSNPTTEKQWNRMAQRDSGGWSRVSRSNASVRRTISRMVCCFWPASMRVGSPGKRSQSTAAVDAVRGKRHSRDWI